MTGITYSQANVSDVQALVNFRIEFLIDLMGPQSVEAIETLRTSLLSYFSDALPNNTYICWVAKSDGIIVGLGGLAVRQHPGGFKNPSGKMGYVMNMYTVPEFRRKGISTNILNKLIASAKEMGIYSFELHATKEGEPVYVKQGFIKHGEPTYRKYG